MKTRLTLCLAILASGGASSAAIIATDSFSATDHPGGDLAAAGGQALSYVLPSSNVGTATIVSETLNLNDSDASASSTVTAIGLLPGTALLTNIGDSISVSLSFQLISTTGTPTFRFGFYNSNGTSASGLGSENDSGYYVSLAAPGSANNLLFFSETGTNVGIMGGTDRTAITASSGSPAGLGTSAHTLVFSMTRSTATTIGFSLSLDGAAAITGSTTNLLTAFDEIAFNTAFNAVTSGTELQIDDIVVDATNVVPEPSSLALAALAGTIALRRRRA